MTERTTDDCTLLRAWQDGDATAGSTLIRRYAPPLHRFFRDKAEGATEDLCQQTLTECVAARDKIEEDGGVRSFRSFLFAVARRRLLNHYRRLRRHDQRIDPMTSTLEGLSARLSSRVARSRGHDRLRAALRNLSIDSQLALELHYWHGLTTPEIAHALDTPAGTIRARLSRARESLRAHLDAAA